MSVSINSLACNLMVFIKSKIRHMFWPRRSLAGILPEKEAFQALWITVSKYFMCTPVGTWSQALWYLHPMNHVAMKRHKLAEHVLKNTKSLKQKSQKLHKEQRRAIPTCSLLCLKRKYTPKTQSKICLYTYANAWNGLKRQKDRSAWLLWTIRGQLLRRDFPSTFWLACKKKKKICIDKTRR